MADPDGSLNINLIGSERIESVVTVTSSRGSPCILCSRSIRATHDLREETCEAESDGWHAAANNANLTFDD